MTMTEMVATSSTRSPEELGRMLTDLRRGRATLKADYREAQRSADFRWQCQTLSALANIAETIDRIEAELSRR